MTVDYRNESDAYINDVSIVATVANPTGRLYYFKAIAIRPAYQGVPMTCQNSNVHIGARVTVRIVCIRFVCTE